VLTLVVIAVDEEDRLGRCLESVPCAVEKVVLDSGSTDGTRRVAEACGARFVRADWPGHVAQKNRALSLASQPWVLSLDADEWLEPEAAEAVARVVADPPAGVDGFRFARCNHWLGTPIRHGRWYPDRKLRLVRRGRGRWVGDDPHDQLVVDGEVADLPGDIGHIPYRDMAEHLRTIDRYTAISARSLAARGVRARRRDLLLRPPLRFVDAYLLRAGFLDGGPGLALAGLGAAYTGLKWGRLWKAQRSASH
jgi:glycosyltransferase involved in cell wall biosynthesis